MCLKYAPASVPQHMGSKCVGMTTRSCNNQLSLMSLKYEPASEPLQVDLLERARGEPVEVRIAIDRSRPTSGI